MGVIELKGIRRHYTVGEVTVKALRGLDLEVERGDFVSVMGPSGSGKSTLMNILGCLDQPTGGSYVLDGTETSRAGSDDFARIRNEKIGFVFQGFNLLSRTTALENVELPLFYGTALNGRELTRRARAALDEVGLGDRLSHTSSQLSGGQQQRVAIARAIVNDPAFVLADEPTGNLDTEMTLEIMSIFQRLNERGTTIVMVTHEPELALYTKRTIILRDGGLVSDERVRAPRHAARDMEVWKEKHILLSAENGGAA
jgi:putative ABC transport system ATP-binding protein